MRKVVFLAIICLGLATAPTVSYANPFFWIIRGLLSSSARSTVGRVGVGAVGRAVATDTAATAATTYRASRAAILLQEISISAIGSIAADEVLALVEDSPEDSPITFTAAYYVVLSQRDRDAAMGMWLAPESKHFRHLSQVQGFQLEDIEELENDGDNAIVRTTVTGQNRGEKVKRYKLDFYLQRTSDGWRVVRQRTVSL